MEAVPATWYVAAKLRPTRSQKKALCVPGLLKARMRGLGADWKHVSATNIYTVHDVNALLASEILPRIRPAGQCGVVLHYARPPILSIEYEMDALGGVSEIVIPTAEG
jgi:hypothetical protein